MRRRAEWVLLVRALGYRAIAVSLTATGIAALVDGNMAGIAALVGGGIVGAMGWLYGYLAFKMRWKPFPLRLSWTQSPGRFARVRSLTLGLGAGVLVMVGSGAIVFGLIGLIGGRQFSGPIDAGIFLLAVGAIAGTTAWARWPRQETNEP